MLEYSTSLQDSLVYILGKGERLSTSGSPLLRSFVPYKKLAEEDELIRSVGYSWPHPVRVYNHLTLWQLLNSAELNLITVPRGLDLDAEEFRPRRHLPTLVTMLVQHQNGCPDPEVSFMVGGSTHVGATLRLRTHPISVALIEAAAAGIITVDADYPNSDE